LYASHYGCFRRGSYQAELALIFKTALTPVAVLSRSLWISPAASSNRQHLTNQILGRPTVSPKPVILEQLAASRFQEKSTNQVVQRKIQVIGATSHQPNTKLFKRHFENCLRCMDISKRLYACCLNTGMTLYGVAKYEHSKRGVLQFSPRHKLQAMQSLASLAAQPMLISYKRRNEKERWDVVQRITNLIKVSSGYLDVADNEADQLMSGILLNAIDNLRVIEIECDEPFFDRRTSITSRRETDELEAATTNVCRTAFIIFNTSPAMARCAPKKGHNPRATII
jgi:hypothetical protein